MLNTGLSAMKKSLLKARGFRPSPENAERLDYAEKLGLNISELINETLNDHLPEKMSAKVKAKQQELKKLLSAPMPA
jgi:hypothetical protein